MRGWENFNRAIQANTILLERCVNWGGVISGFEGLSSGADPGHQVGGL